MVAITSPTVVATPSVLVTGISATGALAAGNAAARPSPREISAVGTPTVADASVSAKIVQQPRGTKVLVFKKKRRKNYRRKRGHRQELTVLRIEGISRGATVAASDESATPVASDSSATPAADVG